MKFELPSVAGIPISFIDLTLSTFPRGKEPLVGQGLLVVEASRSHPDTHHTY